jgi:thymidylate synthase
MVKMNNIEHDYLKLLHDILNNGVEKQDRTGTGTISVFGRQIRHDMSLGFPLLTTKKMPFKTIITELLWFLRGDTNIKFLVDNNCHIWDGDAYKNYLRKVILDKDIVRYLKSYSIDTKGVPTIEFYPKDEYIERIKNDDQFAKKWGELGPVYGRQWRNWNAIFDGGVDQIKNLIQDLKTNPDSRRLMVSAWNVSELNQMILPPCHYGFQCYVREGKYLSLMWNQRSVDTPLGLPFNIASYALLLMMIADEVNMVPDQLIGNLGDCHIYLDQVDGVKEQLTRQPMSLPKVTIQDGIYCSSPSDVLLENYESHPAIKFPLSN